MNIWQSTSIITWLLAPFSLLFWLVSQIRLFLFRKKILKSYIVNPEIYFIDFLPSELHLMDVVIVTAAAILMSLLATLYPAWRASQLLPARELGR